MPAIQRLHILQEGLPVEEQADRIMNTIYSFVAMHISVAELDVFPTSFEALRDTLRETGAHFGEPPPPEVYNDPNYKHEPFVPDTYEELKSIMLNGFSKRITEEVDNYSEEYRTLCAAEEAIPVHENEFLAECRKGWLAWTAGAIFALEEVAPNMSTGSPEDILTSLIGRL